MTGRPAAGAVALVGVVLALAGCANPFDPNDRSTTVAQSAGGLEKHVDGGVREDVDGIVAAVPALGSPASAAWMTGTLGESGGGPGPALRWYDAIVELEPAVADRLREESGAGPASGRLNVVPEISGRMPEGEYLNSESLNALLSDGGTKVYAWLSAEGTTLVLTAQPA